MGERHIPCDTELPGIFLDLIKSRVFTMFQDSLNVSPDNGGYNSDPSLGDSEVTLEGNVERVTKEREGVDSDK